MSAVDDPAHFGRTWAHDYDTFPNPDPADAVAVLAELAGDGRALELAVGTGRVALPLSARGVPVDGVEASVEMVRRMREKPGGDAVPVVVGDMADVPVPGPYRLVYLVFNTITNLLSLERQADCFNGVARVLEPGGAFVVECTVPDPTHFVRGQAVDVIALDDDGVALEVSLRDDASGRVDSQKIFFGSGGYHLRRFAYRECPPQELDLLADRAGLRLRDRWSGWKREPFTATSTSHVSVYTTG